MDLFQTAYNIMINLLQNADARDLNTSVIVDASFELSDKFMNKYNQHPAVISARREAAEKAKQKQAESKEAEKATENA